MLLGCKLIFEYAQTVYLYLDAVSGLNGSYSCWSSSRDEIAGLEGHGGGDVAEELGDGEDEIARGTLLLDHTVKAGDDGDWGADFIFESAGVNLVGDDGADGTEGIEAFATGPLAVRLLYVASGDVVDADVAANIRAERLHRGRSYSSDGR